MKLKSAVRIVALALIGVLFAWVLWRLDWTKLGQRLAGASGLDLAVQATLWLTSVLLRPIRFRYLLGVLGRVEGVDYRTIWAALILGGTVNSFAPMRAGDIVVAVFLRQRLGIGMHQSFVVIVADWACDFTCVVIAFLAALAFAPAVEMWTQHAIVVLIAILLVAFAGLAIILHFRSQAVTLLDGALARLAPRWRAQGRTIAEEFLEGLATISTWRTALPLVAISASIWCVAWLAYWFGLRAVFEDASIASAAFSMAAVALSFVVPLGPGGMGAFEAATVLALTVFDVPLDAALAFAIIAHVLQLGTIALFAMLAVLTRQIDFQALWAGTGKQQ